MHVLSKMSESGLFVFDSKLAFSVDLEFKSVIHSYSSSTKSVNCDCCRQLKFVKHIYTHL